VHGEFLSTLPRVLHDRGATDVPHLLDHVQLTQAIEAVLLVLDLRECRFVFVNYVLHVSQPVVDQA